MSKRVSVDTGCPVCGSDTTSQTGEFCPCGWERDPLGGQEEHPFDDSGPNPRSLGATLARRIADGMIEHGSWDNPVSQDALRRRLALPSPEVAAQTQKEDEREGFLAMLEHGSQDKSGDRAVYAQIFWKAWGEKL